MFYLWVCAPSNAYQNDSCSYIILQFEAFPLVFNDIYHFNLGVGSLPFAAFVVTGGITVSIYLFVMLTRSSFSSSHPSTPYIACTTVTTWSRGTTVMAALLLKPDSRLV